MPIEDLEKKIISLLKEKKYTKEQLRKKTNIKGEIAQQVFDKALEEVEINGQIFLDDSDYYHIFDDSIVLIQGKIFITKDGIGHFTGKKEEKKLKFTIPHEDLNGALDHDIVIISDQNKKRYDSKLASVVKIIKRSEQKEIYKYLGNGIFKLYNGTSDVYIRKDKKECQYLPEGSLVLAKIDKVPIENNIYNGEISKIYGHADDPKSLIYLIGLKYGFDHEFTEKVMNEAQKLPVKVSKEDTENRVDLRAENIFTIDGEDTKDIDDAISIIKENDKYILKVHIADVSHYIKDNKVLFEEAIKRGNSAYLADSVFPMFPHIISNGICSLNPNVDRLTKTVEIEIDQNGNILNSKVFKSVIKSRKQMTYNDVNRVLKGQKVEGYEAYEQDLQLMNKLAKLIEKKRSEEGALEFYNQELKIKTDIDGHTVNIKKFNQNDAEKLIENFMIIANTEVTNNYGYLYSPFVFRVHPEPDEKTLLETLEDLKHQEVEDKTLEASIISLEKKIKSQKTSVHPKDLKILLDKIKDKPYFESVSNSILTSMKKAVYLEENIDHFALATDSYTHFTSPIRRAADLVNHTIIDLVMEYNSSEEDTQTLDRLEQIDKRLPGICLHISETEILAEKAEKEIEKIKQIEYFEDNIEDYEGPVKAQILRINRSGINAKFGVFDVIVPSELLSLSGYNYKRESRTYINKDETLKIGDRVYLFCPEVLKEKEQITYTEISKSEDNILTQVPERIKRKSYKINPQ